MDFAQNCTFIGFVNKAAHSNTSSIRANIQYGGFPTVLTPVKTLVFFCRRKIFFFTIIIVSQKFIRDWRNVLIPEEYIEFPAENMKSDIEELMPRLLPVDFGEKTEEPNLNGPPRNPQEYLRQVQ